MLMSAADLVVAVTGRRGLLPASLVRRGQGILALTNPDPEIRPEEALAAGAAFAADGRSVNNLLGFPGILRAAVDCRVRRITPAMYVAAARAIASMAQKDELVPNPLRLEVHRAVARAVAGAAQADKVARPRNPLGLPTGPPVSIASGAGRLSRSRLAGRASRVGQRLPAGLVSSARAQAAPAETRPRATAAKRRLARGGLGGKLKSKS